MYRSFSATKTVYDAIEPLEVGEKVTLSNVTTPFGKVTKPTSLKCMVFNIGKDNGKKYITKIEGDDLFVFRIE